MTTVRGIEAIKLNLPPTNAEIDANIREEKCRRTPAPTVSAAMTSVERYRQEWRQLLNDLDENFEQVRDLAFSGELKVSKFRSIYWALLLRVLNADYHSWNGQRKQQRNRYEQLKQEFVKNPHDIEGCDDDPLSQSKQSVWNQFFSDQELFAVIRQDVIRTFPGVDFFRKQVIQTAMSNILFYYAREHPYMCYRQGMHEILAPILFVMFSDHQALLQFQELAKTQIDEILVDVLNPQYLEADSYSIFSRLMASIESYYRITNMTQTPGGYFRAQTEDEIKQISTEVEVIGQLNSIRDKILAKEDLHLHNYLLKLDIPLHIFGIRWLRLLFGREFALLDLLVLWDAIFADSDQFNLPNFILVAMLIRIRDKLLMNDYTTCLTFLMRYPANVDINLILRHALHMQMPKKFDCPSNAFIYFTMNPATAAPLPLSKNMSLIATIPSTQSQKIQQESSGSRGRVNFSNTTINLSQRQQRSRSTSLGASNGVQIEQQIELMQAKNAADSAALERIRAAPETDRVIMDGFSENSPELLRLELKNAQTVITVARNKLLKYLQTVRKNVTKNGNSEELGQALDGIEELCSFLDIKFMFPLQTRAAPIDQALEANESQRQAKKAATYDFENEFNSIKPQINANNAVIASALDAAAILEDEPLQATVANVNMSPCTAYEKPDNGFMLSSFRILGNLKEIELIPIATDEQIVKPSSSNDSNISGKSKSSVTQKIIGLPSLDPLTQHEK